MVSGGGQAVMRVGMGEGQGRHVCERRQSSQPGNQDEAACRELPGEQGMEGGSFRACHRREEEGQSRGFVAFKH